MKVLVITTSNAWFGGPNPHPTGVWLSEFTEPYMHLYENSVELTVASPLGGQMPIDPRTLPTPEQQEQWQPALTAASQALTLDKLEADDFDAIFLPGGHGPMFDLPENAQLHRVLAGFHEQGKLIAAVCHGPAGLVGAKRRDGAPLVQGVTLTAYSWAERSLPSLIRRSRSSWSNACVTSAQISSRAKSRPITSSGTVSSSRAKTRPPV